MKKLILLGAVLFALGVSGVAQSRQEKFSQAKEEIKSALVAKLSLSDKAAKNIAAIEEEFHQKLEAIAALGEIPVKDKEVKLNEAHVARRASLMSVPLTGRQMEDAVEISDAVWRKHGL